MDKKLKSMFDYHSFAPNPRLSKLIEETENRYAHELDDDDLLLVNAAGSQYQQEPDKYKKQKP